MMRSFVKQFARVAILGLFGTAVAACSGIPSININTGGGASANQSAPTSTPIPTAPAAAKPTYLVQRGDVQNIFQFSGRWNPRDQLQLNFPIAGTIRRVNVQRDQTVKKGDLLADFQIDTLESQLQSDQLNLQTANDNLASSDTSSVGSVSSNEVALANANVNLQNVKSSTTWTQVATAKNNLDDAQRQVDAAQRTYDDAISRANNPSGTIDAAYNALKQAQTSLKNAQVSYWSAAQTYNNQKFSVDTAQNNVIQAQLNLQSARTGGLDPTKQQAVRQAQLAIDQVTAQIAQSSLYAPLDGVVLEVDIKPGDAVKAFDIVIIIGQPEPREAIANVAIGDAQKMSVGLVGTCNVTGKLETAVQCVIRRIPQSAKDTDQTTRVAASLENLKLANGQLIDVNMPIQVSKNVLWLPPAAVRTFQNRTFVVVQAADGEHSVDVTLGLATTDRDEIKSGVKEGDIVVGP